VRAMPIFRIARPVIAVLLAVSLTILPGSATMAMTHAAKTEMAINAPPDDCPCCNSPLNHSCQLACCHIQAISADSIMIFAPLPHTFPDRVEETGSGLTVAPDPPPPRF